MNFSLIRDALDLLEQFASARSSQPERFVDDIDGFKRWVCDKNEEFAEPEWEGKEGGRSPESVISTLIVHMNRYAKNYSRSAMYNSDFSTQEEFIYLINLRAFGPMSKMDLIKKNVHEKPAGMQTINRLISQGWIKQAPSKTDKRKKVITITDAGESALEARMGKIRQATRIVSGNLTYEEKMQLIRLLKKLDQFHHPIYEQNLSGPDLLPLAEKAVSDSQSIMQ